MGAQVAHPEIDELPQRKLVRDRDGLLEVELRAIELADPRERGASQPERPPEEAWAPPQACGVNGLVGRRDRLGYPPAADQRLDRLGPQGHHVALGTGAARDL